MMPKILSPLRSSKQKLRKQYLKSRLSFDSQDANLRIQNYLLKELEPYQRIGLYMPMQNEPKIESLVTYFPQKRFYLPRVKGRELEYIEYQNGDTLKTSSFGVAEPLGPAFPIDQIDIFLIPGIAFTKSGFRLGYGGGFYDRFLAQEKLLNVPTIGISFSFLIKKELPIEAHDIKMQNILSEDGMM